MSLFPLPLILWWLAAVNLIGAAVTAWDKSCAKRGAWRVSEKTLFLFCLLGGCPGVYLTMKWIRHKTRHLRFMLGIPLIFLTQLAVCAYFYFK